MAAGVKFTGGGKLLTKLSKIAKNAKKARLTAGFYKGATYENGTPVAQVAAANNFGTQDSGGFIPPRPFFSDAVAENKNKWAEGIAHRMRLNGGDAEDALKRTGEQMRSDIVDSINDGNYQENAESTKRRKAEAGGSRQQTPLQDTQLMLSSVAYQYNDEAPQYDNTRRNATIKRIKYYKDYYAKKKAKP